MESSVPAGKDMDYVDRIIGEERDRIEREIGRLFGKRPTGRLGKAMTYTVTAGGKRLRPVLMVRTYRALGGRRSSVYPLAISVELIHSYSLIHDDLPQMDDDDYRRGRPTCHKVFGEKTALVAGLALIVKSFSSLLKGGGKHGVDPATIRGLFRELAAAAGAAGLVSGQAADMAYESREFDEKVVTYIHLRKTAALFGAASAMGSILAGADRRTVDGLRTFGIQLGIAFQIVDDILDLTGRFEDLGKRVGKDAERGKATFPALFGLEDSRKRAERHAGKAVRTLGRLGIGDRFLELLPYWILKPSVTARA